MKLTTASALSAGTLGLAGLVAGGLLALPGAASGASADQTYLKRDDDTPDVVLVNDDDDDDDTYARESARDDTRDDTRDTRSRDTRSQTSTRDHTGTGDRTGRDKSRERGGRDVTTDGPGKRAWDYSAHSTNDRSRHNTRR